ncbi:N-acetyltransferase family protein [Maritalea sp.]|uniref:GNAT family N-acetyltransferase n=1 Tax=Maritalea sp. TaxID=2003361 RepID=UPI003EF5F990
MIVREFKKQDIPRVTELSQQLADHVKDPDPKLKAETLQELAFGDDRWFEVLVIEDSGNVVGFVAYAQRFELHTNSRTLFISDLVVSDTHRRQGVGEQLLEALRTVAVTRNCKAMTLEVWIENETARAFYAGRGAERADDVKLLRLPI